MTKLNHERWLLRLIDNRNSLRLAHAHLEATFRQKPDHADPNDDLKFPGKDEITSDQLSASINKYMHASHLHDATTP